MDLNNNNSSLGFPPKPSDNNDSHHITTDSDTSSMTKTKTMATSSSSTPIHNHNNSTTITKRTSNSRTIQNPYSSHYKRKRKEEEQLQLQQRLQQEINNPVVGSASTNNPYSTHPTALLNQQHQPQHQLLLQGKDDKDDQNQSQNQNQEHQEMTMSNQNTYTTTKHFTSVDRLPSRNVTFTCAEIVTLQEAEFGLFTTTTKNNNTTQKGHDDRMNKRMISYKPGSSIRTTGVILYIDTQFKWILLGSCGDSGYGGKSSDRSPINLNSKTKHHHQQQQQIVTNNKTQQSNSTRRLVCYTKYNNSKTTQQRFKKPVSAKSSSLSSLSTKQNLEPTQLQTIQRIIRNQKENSTSSVIVVDITSIPSLFGCKVNDVVMIIGEVMVHSWYYNRTTTTTTTNGSTMKHSNEQSSQMRGSDDATTMKLTNHDIVNQCNNSQSTYFYHNPDLGNDFYNTIEYLSSFFHQSQQQQQQYDGEMNPQQQHVSNNNTHNDHDDSTNHDMHPISTTTHDDINQQEDASSRKIQHMGGFIKTRILRNSNGLDLNLYHKTLMLRREFMRKQIGILEHNSNPPSTSQEETETNYKQGNTTDVVDENNIDNNNRIAPRVPFGIGPDHLFITM